MIFPNTKIKEIFKNFKKEDYLYLSIVILFFIAVIVVFSLAVRFLTVNINKVFYSENPQGSGGLNMGDYALVTKKLNLDNKNTTTVEVAQKSPESQETAVLTVLDKHLITIKILNSTETSGLASSLEKKITSEGFIVSKTGNEATNYEITTLLIQENKSEYSSTLLDAIHKIYPKAVAKITTEASDVDAVIIIGNN